MNINDEAQRDVKVANDLAPPNSAGMYLLGHSIVCALTPAWLPPQILNVVTVSSS